MKKKKREKRSYIYIHCMHTQLNQQTNIHTPTQNGYVERKRKKKTQKQI